MLKTKKTKKIPSPKGHKKKAPKVNIVKNKIMTSAVTTIPPAASTDKGGPLNESQDTIQKHTALNTQLANKAEENIRLAGGAIFTRSQNSKISPHILDLKKIQSEKEAYKEVLNDRGNNIGEEIFNALQDKRKLLVNNFKSTYQKICPKPKSDPIKYTIPENSSEITNSPKERKSSKIPKIKRPRLAMPHLTLPQFNIKLPELKLPRLKLPKIKLPGIQIGHLMLPCKWPRTILAFIVFCIIFVLPFNLYAYYQNMQGKKSDVLRQATEALAHLTISQKAASAQEFYYTNLELQQSAYNFNLAKNELENVNIIIKNLIQLLPNYSKQYTTAKNLIDSGEKLTKNAAIITNALEKIKNNTGDQLNLTANLIILKDALNTTVPDLESVKKNMGGIYLNEIPDEYLNKVKFLQATIPIMVDNIKNFISVSDLLLKILGHESEKRYLFLFQNNNEIRPTGGFIGSFALVDIDRGNIKKIDIPGGGPYDLKAGLKINLESPDPLHLMNPRWEFQDANWFADLPTSAEKLIYIYEKSGGPTVDGIIFINATFLESILEITGPINLPNYNITLTKDNFFIEIQKNVELDYDKEINKPKQIIADLTPLLIDRLLHLQSDGFLHIFNVLLASLAQKEIQVYFSDPKLENFVLDNNWGGQLKQTQGDYLNIVSTNIAGEKTDAKIEQRANLSVAIGPDGSIINTLTITKTHYGKKGELFYGVPNVDYLRIYVPKGSELLKAEGFEPIAPEFFIPADPKIYQMDADIINIKKTKTIDPQNQTETFIESGKTVFANWFQIAPGDTKSVTVTYKLPFGLNFKDRDDDLVTPENIWMLLKEELNSYFNSNNDHQVYSLLWQKQSGKRNFNLDLKITAPKGFNSQFVYPENLQSENDIFYYQTELDMDKLFAIVFNR